MIYLKEVKTKIKNKGTRDKTLAQQLKKAMLKLKKKTQGQSLKSFEG